MCPLARLWVPQPFFAFLFSIFKTSQGNIPSYFMLFPPSWIFFFPNWASYDAFFFLTPFLSFRLFFCQVPRDHSRPAGNSHRFCPKSGAFFTPFPFRRLSHRRSVVNQAVHFLSPLRFLWQFFPLSRDFDALVLTSAIQGNPRLPLSVNAFSFLFFFP